MRQVSRFQQLLIILGCVGFLVTAVSEAADPRGPAAVPFEGQAAESDEDGQQAGKKNG